MVARILLLVVFMTSGHCEGAVGSECLCICKGLGGLMLKGAGCMALAPAGGRASETLLSDPAAGGGPRDVGGAVMRLRGGFKPKKTRKSVSKRKPLRLKYKIKKRVVQVHIYSLFRDHTIHVIPATLEATLHWRPCLLSSCARPCVSKHVCVNAYMRISSHRNLHMRRPWPSANL